MSKCIVCGKEICPPEPYSINVCSHKCFSKYFWNNTLDENALVIDGTCYHDGGFVENKNSVAFLGFSGNMFYIQKDTGEIIKTNNLWCNGKIPKDRKIKNNAKFINTYGG